MKEKILILFLFVGSICCGQRKYEINLPSEKFSVVHNSQPVNIYIDKKKNIFLEGKKIKLKDIADSFLKIKSNLPLAQRNYLRPNLYIDKDVAYSYVQRITNEISSAFVFHVLYATESLESKKGIVQKLPVPFFYKRFKENSEESEGAMLIEELDLPGLAWQPKLEQLLYQQKFTEAKNILKGKRFSIINFKKKDLLEIDGESLLLREIDLIIEKLKNQDILFITYDKSLSYGDYISILSKLRDRKKIFISSHIISFERKKYIDFIEISNELQIKMKQKGVKL